MAWAASDGITGLYPRGLGRAARPRPPSSVVQMPASVYALLRLINDILDLSKIEAGKLELEHAPFELKPLLDEIVDSMAWRAREQGLTMKAVIPAAARCRVAGDSARLRQVIVNLLGNALKFTERG